MELNLDSHTVEIPCPKCSHKIQKTIGELKREPDSSCPHCGATIHYDTKGLDEGIKSANKSLATLAATISKMGKK